MKEKDFLKRIIASKTGDSERIRKSVYEKHQYNKENLVKTKITKQKGGFIMRKRVVAVIVSIVVILTGFAIAASIYNPQPTQKGDAKGATYNKIYDVIENFNKLQNQFNPNSILDFASIGAKKEAPARDGAAPDMLENGADYSSTNIQEEGVDEGDIVKNDGEFIYKINTSGCLIISATEGSMQLLSQIKVDNYLPLELYVLEDKLIMIGGIYEYINTSATSYSSSVNCFYYMPYTKTDIRIYDISDKSKPELLRKLVIDGTYNTSRILTQNNKLFYMVNYDFRYGEKEQYIPRVADSLVSNGKTEKIPAKDIYYYDDIINYSYLIIGNIDISDPTESEQNAFLGLNGIIYVSPSNVYVASYDYRSQFSTNVFGWVRQDYKIEPSSRIVKIALGDLKQKAVTRILGSVKDRYSLDEFQGNLRIATTVRFSSTYSMVYVLSEDLSVLGKIDKIAEGESIYAVRFNGERGSLVTFEQVDPYFNLDLSNPAKPLISKGLKEDGFSSYIHYLGDSGYTIGVGQDTRLAQTNWGERVQILGLKVSLYDNNSGEAVNVKTWTLEGNCQVELFSNPKALLYDEQKGLFAFAYENRVYDNYYNSSLKQGLAVFRFDVEAEKPEDKLSYSGTLSNLDISSSEYNYYEQYRTFVTRGVRIGGYIYTISDKYIISYDMETLVEVDRLTSNEEQVDFR